MFLEERCRAGAGQLVRTQRRVRDGNTCISSCPRRLAEGSKYCSCGVPLSGKRAPPKVPDHFGTRCCTHLEAATFYKQLSQQLVLMVPNKRFRTAAASGTKKMWSGHYSGELLVMLHCDQLQAAHLHCLTIRTSLSALEDFCFYFALRKLVKTKIEARDVKGAAQLLQNRLSAGSATAKKEPSAIAGVSLVFLCCWIGSDLSCNCA
eukprot:1117635-Amphidinium_carterae.1